MAIGLGRRTRNVAMLAGALATLVGSIPGQPLRDQIRDIVAAIAEQTEGIADDLEESDGDSSLLSDEVRAAS